MRFLVPAALLALVSTPACAEDLQALVARRFAAVQARDLPGVESTLTSGEGLLLMLPNGKLLKTRAEFLAFHTEWFASKSWTMRFDPVGQVVGADLAVITVRTRYEGVLDDGKPYWSENWLALTFRKEAGGWRLVQDQNTRIRQSTDPTP